MSASDIIDAWAVLCYLFTMQSFYFLGAFSHDIEATERNISSDSLQFLFYS